MDFDDYVASGPGLHPRPGAARRLGGAAGYSWRVLNSRSPDRRGGRRNYSVAYPSISNSPWRAGTVPVKRLRGQSPPSPRGPLGGGGSAGGTVPPYRVPPPAVRLEPGGSSRAGNLRLNDKSAWPRPGVRLPFLDRRFVESVARCPWSTKVNAKFRIPKHCSRRADAASLGPRPARSPTASWRPRSGPSRGRPSRALTDLSNASFPEDYLDRHELGFCFSSKARSAPLRVVRREFVAAGARIRGAYPWWTS